MYGVDDRVHRLTSPLTPTRNPHAVPVQTPASPPAHPEITYNGVQYTVERTPHTELTFSFTFTVNSFTTEPQVIFLLLENDNLGIIN